MLLSLLARLSDDARRSLLYCTTTFSIVALLAFGMAAIPSTQASAKDHDGALGVLCGDSNGDETLSVSDALEIVRFSAGIGEECVPPACDTNSSGAVTVTDGLIVMSHAVGLDAGMQCPGQRGVGGNILVTLDFEDRIPGEMIDRLTPVEGDLTIEVHGSNPNSTFPDRNAALIFDSSCKDGCSGGDDDLGSPNEDFDGPGVGNGGGEGREFPNDQGLGNILIIAENLKDGDGDGLIDDPDDQGAGPVTIDFDFGLDPIEVASTITLLGITYIDVEHIEMNPLLELFDDSGALVDVLSLPTTGNNGVNVFVLPDPMPGVASFRLSVHGSMGIDNIVFSVDLPPTSSTTTTTMGSTTTSTTTTTMPATGPTVEKEGNAATAIRNLPIGDSVYDVEFEFGRVDQVYDGNCFVGECDFTFTTQADATSAVGVVNLALNTLSGGSDSVGPPGGPTEKRYHVPYDFTDLFLLAGAGQFGVEIWGDNSPIDVFGDENVAFAIFTTVGANPGTTFEREGDKATAIRNLPVGDTVYDVEFLAGLVGDVYGGDCLAEECEYDFTNEEDAADAVRAANLALNTLSAGSLFVGPPGGGNSDHYSIPYATDQNSSSVSTRTALGPTNEDRWTDVGKVGIHVIQGWTWAVFTEAIPGMTTTTMAPSTTLPPTTTTMPPMGECGDGTVDPGEDCDPGAPGSGECCTEGCTFEGAGSACGDPGGQCTDPDTCDGAGTCVLGDFKPAETPCSSPEDTECSNPDSCNGMGQCLARNEPDGTQCMTDPCGDAATCQAGQCTCPTTTTVPEPTTTTTSTTTTTMPPDAVCAEQLCAMDEDLAQQCESFVEACLLAEPTNEEECLAGGLFVCEGGACGQDACATDETLEQECRTFLETCLMEAGSPADQEACVGAAILTCQEEPIPPDACHEQLCANDEMLAQQCEAFLEACLLAEPAHEDECAGGALFICEGGACGQDGCANDEMLAQECRDFLGPCLAAADKDNDVEACIAVAIFKCNPEDPVGCTTDEDCQDGSFCTGEEKCGPGGACEDAVGDPCGPGETCDEERDICIEEP